MTDDTKTIEKPDTMNAEIEAERARALELAGRKELAVERAGEVALAAGGGVDYATLKDLHTLAGWLCKAGPMIPPWLQNNHGGMFGICMKAHELGISPLALANWSYVTEQWAGGQKIERVAYESQFFHAIIERKNGPLKGRLHYEIIGEGDERRCRVWATLKGEDEPRSFLSDTLKSLHPGHNERGRVKGSPLWDTKPEVQLFYNAARDFARIYCPDVIAGMYGRDEIEDYRPHFQGPQNAKDVTPQTDLSPKLLDRLTGPKSDGFAQEQAIQNIDAAIAAAKPAPTVIEEVEKVTKKPNAKRAGKKATEGAPSGGTVINGEVLDGAAASEEK